MYETAQFSQFNGAVMKSLFNRIVLSMGFLVAGCNADAADSDGIAYPIAPALDVEIVLNQQEIEVDVTSAAPVAGQFGLLGAQVGAAIDSANTNAAEKRVVDIRNLLVDYNFNQAVEGAIKTAVASPGISPAPNITVRKTASDAAAQQGYLAGGQPQNVLRLIPRYTIASDFESITVGMQALYIGRTVKDSGQIKQSSIFSRNYSFELPLQARQDSGADEDAERWVAIGKDGLVALLNQGVMQVSDMLAYDFSIEGRALAVQAPSVSKTEFKGKQYKGTVLRQTPDFIWVANGKSKTRNIIGVQPVVDAVAPAAGNVEEPVALN